jgi:HAD superfamily hydrolase (TIGR01509 family)
MSRVIAALDTSEVARAVLEVAACFATMLDAELTAVHVIEDGAMPRIPERGTVEERGGTLEVLRGAPVPTLVVRADEPDVVLTVIGARAGPEGPRPAGHTALELAQRTACPLLVVPPRTDRCRDRRLERAVVPLDGSATVSRSLESPLDLLVEAGVEVVAVHVYEEGRVPQFLDQPQHDYPSLRHEFLVQQSRRPASLELRVGTAWSAALACASAHDADLIVLSWKQDLSAGHADLVREMLARSEVPLLLVAETALPHRADALADHDGLAALRALDAVLFDLDGVVTDTATLHEAAWRELFDAYRRERIHRGASGYAPFTRDDYRRHIDGRPRIDGTLAFLASRGIELPLGRPTDPPDRETARGLAERKDQLFLAALARRGPRVFPSTIELIARLRDHGVARGLYSASRNARTVAEQAGVTGLFDAIVDGCDADELGLPGKPDPAVPLELARRLAVAPGRAAVIDDALAGVEAGRRGGFALVVGVDRLDQAAALTAAGADLVVADLESLRDSPRPPGRTD